VSPYHRHHRQDRSSKRSKPHRGDAIAVKWNTCDWWPATIASVRSDGRAIEVRRKEAEGGDGGDGSSLIVASSGKWA